MNDCVCGYAKERPPYGYNCGLCGHSCMSPCHILGSPMSEAAVRAREEDRMRFHLV
jgi:hypothetical protein